MNWKAAPLKHRDENRIALYFENQELIQQVKQINGARWSQQKKLWHIPDTIENRIQFELKPTRRATFWKPYTI
jgi:integrase/recombinase XerD